MYRFSCLAHCIASINHDSSELRHKGGGGKESRKREGGLVRQEEWNKFTAEGTESLKRASASFKGALPTSSTMQLGPLTLPNLKQFLKAELPVCSLPSGKNETCYYERLSEVSGMCQGHTYVYMTICSEVLLLTGIFSFTEMFKCSRVFNDVL